MPAAMKRPSTPSPCAAARSVRTASPMARMRAQIRRGAAQLGGARQRRPDRPTGCGLPAQNTSPPSRSYSAAMLPAHSEAHGADVDHEIGIGAHEGQSRAPRLPRSGRGSPPPSRCGRPQARCRRWHRPPRAARSGPAGARRGHSRARWAPPSACGGSPSRRCGAARCRPRRRWRPRRRGARRSSPARARRRRPGSAHWRPGSRCRPRRGTAPAPRRLPRRPRGRCASRPRRRRTPPRSATAAAPALAMIGGVMELAKWRPSVSGRSGAPLIAGRAGQHNRRNDAALLCAEPRGLPPRSDVCRPARPAPTSTSAAAIRSPTTCRSGSTSRAGAAWWSSRSRRWPTSTPTCARATTRCRCLAGPGRGRGRVPRRRQAARLFHDRARARGRRRPVRRRLQDHRQARAHAGGADRRGGATSHRLPQDRRGGRGGRGAGGHGLRASPPARGAGGGGGAGQHGRGLAALGARSPRAGLSLRLLRPPQPLLRRRGGQGPGRALSCRARRLGQRQASVGLRPRAGAQPTTPITCWRRCCSRASSRSCRRSILHYCAASSSAASMVALSPSCLARPNSRVRRMSRPPISQPCWRPISSAPRWAASPACTMAGTVGVRLETEPPMFFPGFHARAHRGQRRQHQAAPRRIGAAAAAPARQSADACHVARRGAGDGEALHRDLPGPARLRRLAQAGGDAGPCALRQEGDGARTWSR